MPSAIEPPQTLYDKVFQDHIVDEKDDGTILLYIGRSTKRFLEAFFLTSTLQTGISSTKSLRQFVFNIAHFRRVA